MQFSSHMKKCNTQWRDEGTPKTHTRMGWIAVSLWEKWGQVQCSAKHEQHNLPYFLFETRRLCGSRTWKVKERNSPLNPLPPPRLTLPGNQQLGVAGRQAGTNYWAHGALIRTNSPTCSDTERTSRIVPRTRKGKTWTGNTEKGIIMLRSRPGPPPTATIAGRKHREGEESRGTRAKRITCRQLHK